MLNKKRVTLIEITDEFGVKIPALVAEVEIIGNNTEGCRSIVRLLAPNGEVDAEEIAIWTTDGLNGVTGTPNIINTDGNTGRTIYIGSVDPNDSYTLEDGDIWIEL